MLCNSLWYTLCSFEQVAENLYRRFYIMTHDSCPTDYGWLVVLDVGTQGVCPVWEIGRGPYPRILYSQAVGAVQSKWHVVHVDAMTMTMTMTVTMTMTMTMTMTVTMTMTMTTTMTWFY